MFLTTLSPVSSNLGRISSKINHDDRGYRFDNYLAPNISLQAYMSEGVADLKSLGIGSQRFWSDRKSNLLFQFRKTNSVTPSEM